MTETTIELYEELFSAQERVVAFTAEMRAVAFRFDSGVAALRVENACGAITMLPFQGQQIWDATFHGRRLTMDSMFDQPRSGVAYLETYGAFLVHCGITAMGGPGPSDNHPLHGEIPNVRYDRAVLRVGTDGLGAYMAVGGTYRHAVAFATKYEARPQVRLRADASQVEISMEVENLKRTPMELMYLAHINFRPVDHGRLVYTAPCDTDHVRVRSVIPSHITPKPGYREFLERLEREPDVHNVLAPGLPYDPEAVLYVDYLADDDGWAHTLQVHPDGGADYVAHHPDQLPKGVRWISRMEDQNCIGIVLPATAEPEGYTAEKAKGNVVTVAPGAVWRTEMIAGAMTPEEAAAMERRIGAILG